ncbi:MAG: Inner membrane protein YbaL [Deltaproteobacteria bacterium ADurb.Bin510]|nr:MAG: Inner membrane protein YbaL [Deltaproteobacteria bacterium ADurb.Bin510]
MGAGLALAQVGEFSFILAGSGLSYGLIDTVTYQLFLAVSIVTMALTPLTLELRTPLAAALLKLPLREKARSGLDSSQTAAELNDHLIIVGFGVNGRNVALAAASARIPYVVIELNPDTVRRQRRAGQPIFFGDATQEAVLRHAGLMQARIMVLAIPDLMGCRQITALAKRLNPAVHLIVRTRYLREVPELYELGADEVIPEEFETSIEIFSRVMERYLVAVEDVERLTDELRADGYRVLRQRIPDTKAICELGLSMPDFKIEVRRVEAGCRLAGRTLAESEVGRCYRVSVLAIRRAGAYILNPTAEDLLEPGDEVVLAGQWEKLELIRPAFRA